MRPKLRIVSVEVKMEACLNKSVELSILHRSLNMEQELRERERLKQAKEEQSTLLGQTLSSSSIPNSSTSPLLNQVGF